MLWTAQSPPPCSAFDTGLRPDPFPARAASLLPGLLAATRTGLPPASDDELTTTDQPPTRSTSCLLGAREWLSVGISADKGIPALDPPNKQTTRPQSGPCPPGRTADRSRRERSLTRT